MTNNAKPPVPSFRSFRSQRSKASENCDTNKSSGGSYVEGFNKRLHSKRTLRRSTHEHRGSHETTADDASKLFVIDRVGDLNSAKYGPSSHSAPLNTTSSGTFEGTDREIK